MFKENKQLFNHGSIIELFSFHLSSVVLLTYNEGESVKPLSSGYFSVKLFMKAICPIFATVCFVEDFQWPLTKDTVMIRMAKRTFIVALPGLLYGLQFPDICPEVDINTLERVFMKFCHYKDINDNGLGYPLEDNEPNLWNRLRHRIGPMANESLVQLGQSSELSRFQALPHNPCFVRASLMSATTKLITESMVRLGTLTSTHISIRGTNPPEMLHHDLASASVNVFSYIVDAIEHASIVAFGLDHPVRDVVEPSLPSASCHDIGFKVWCLNKYGLENFMHLLGPLHNNKNGQLSRDQEFSRKRRSKRKRRSNYFNFNDYGMNINAGGSTFEASDATNPNACQVPQTREKRSRMIPKWMRDYKMPEE